MAKVFLDTNVLVYAADNHDPVRRDKARSAIRRVVETEIPVISTQVLQEFYIAAVTKLKIEPLLAKEILHGFHNMETVQIDLGLIEQGIDISILARISFWDGLILAAAEQASCSTLLTEDLNAGQSVRGIRLENPFLEDSP